ncbi:hypothetical protein [Oscillatoria sp. FACHB-1406]|uniref:hypothetical protein n=1 Tax=Oscillatoria sp. FACHB-1406 TaxID=2692846 RepID=UPI0016899F63|nr:hypothetical protein [Oscillatoria sp. FACHB-1406]MBD2576582.1 hypothetical protein [Oscillatoria sp. FACHB-1406]
MRSGKNCYYLRLTLDSAVRSLKRTHKIARIYLLAIEPSVDCIIDRTAIALLETQILTQDLHQGDEKIVDCEQSRPARSSKLLEIPNP